MIKVFTGFSGPGGSTVAFNNLVNLFNANGMEACLYGPHLWEGITCKFKQGIVEPSPEDTVIYHFMPSPTKPCKKLILSCHETTLFPIAQIPSLKYDAIHFVSEFQKGWQGVEGTVIPNVISKYSPCNKKTKVAGIIGSIDKNKRIPMSIKWALKDGHDDIRIYGNISDGPHFANDILPLLGSKVSYRGVSSDMQDVYNQVTDVYHSPKLETYNMIKPECELAGVNYKGAHGNDTKAEYWDIQRILREWKKLLYD